MALVETIATRQLVAAASDEARAAGVRLGMTLVQARAVCPGLLHAPHETQRDARSLEGLARWLTRFSPTIAVEAPDAIFVEVTGTERLFRGMSRLVALASDALASVRVNAVIAVAPTPGAAWALAYAGRDRAVVEDDDLHAAVASLPVESLRIGPETASTLRRLGIDTCGLLLGIPRETLPARFGEVLLTRLDQAVGHVPEPLVPLLHSRPISEMFDFDGEVESFDVLHMAVKKLLAERVVPELARRGLGVKQIEIEFRRLYALPIKQVVPLSRASRNATGLFKLISLAMENLTSSEGFTGVRLSVPAAERLTDEQALLMEQEEQVRAVELDHLIERLRARFGEGVILQSQLAEAHTPERACVLVPAQPIRRSGSAQQSRRNDRPLNLLVQPVEVGAIVSPSPEGDGSPVSFTLDGAVHRIVYAIGPERISGRWWDGNEKTRDYFEVEDAQAIRYWLFRVVQTGKWYVHGMFN